MASLPVAFDIDCKSLQKQLLPPETQFFSLAQGASFES
jgi:hypothetical protein